MKPSQIMFDKSQTILAEQIGKVVGVLDDAIMMAVNRALTLWLILHRSYGMFVWLRRK